MRLADLTAGANPLARHYSRFRVADRLLLTGHSHQAWPDRALAGQIRAFEDAAEQVDAKWGRAFEQADRIRQGFTRLMADPTGRYALASNTHDLVLRFLSALPLRRRPRLLTTDGEFHTLRRQLDRLSEEGIEVVKVPAEAATAAGELARQVDDRTAAVFVSSVFFGSGAIAEGLGDLLRACRRVGAELLVDAYHSLNVTEFPLRELGLEEAFVVGGGYKYCQLGEGNCFLRLPAHADELRPVVTGWYAEFDALAASRREGEVAYGRGASRFAGSTYDPVSHYRAAEVFDFFAEQGLTPAFLRQVSQHQIGLLAAAFDRLDLPVALIDRDRNNPLDKIAGFLALRSLVAGEVCDALRERGVATDHRGNVLRLGPAPYLSDAQLETAMGQLGEVIRNLAARSTLQP